MTTETQEFYIIFHKFYALYRSICDLTFSKLVSPNISGFSLIIPYTLKTKLLECKLQDIKKSLLLGQHLVCSHLLFYPVLSIHILLNSIPKYFVTNFHAHYIIYQNIQVDMNSSNSEIESRVLNP